MWRLQFFGPYDWLVLIVAILTMVTSGVAFYKAMPDNTSDFAVHYYKYRRKHRSDPYGTLSEKSVKFIGSLTEMDEHRIRRALGYTCLIATPELIDLSYPAKVSSSSAILPFPISGPWLGDGQFTTQSEVEFLIDKGIIREIPIPLSIAAGERLELFCGESFIRIVPTSGTTYNAYIGTPMARELILAGEDSNYWLQTMLWRLQTRIFPKDTIYYGAYSIETDEKVGRRWVQPKSLVKFTVQ